jgi:hypothetical protein
MWRWPLFDLFACAALVCLAACGVGVFLICFSARGWLSGCLPAVLAFPCFLSGLLALPLCGAAPTSLCRLQREVGKRKQLTPLIPKRVPRTVAVVVHLESVFSHIPRW